jgi:hypothetical protein
LLYEADILYRSARTQNLLYVELLENTSLHFLKVSAIGSFQDCGKRFLSLLLHRSWSHYMEMNCLRVATCELEDIAIGSLHFMRRN